ncbi:hypothetical protein N9K59_02810 [Candidatus Thioglobus sp.]|nr:hypothetical protein [Candidatus Thioglobus sp.]
MVEIIQKFKGGSLSSTNLLKNDKGEYFVRKTVSLISNREYGFQRWYSQMKRLQRYSVLFPGVFPTFLEYGLNGDEAYFDIEYFPSAINAQEYIFKCKSQDAVEVFFSNLMDVLSVLYTHEMPSSSKAIDLYLNEEIDQRLDSCIGNKKFTDFLKYKEIVFNGIKVESFISQIKDYKKMCHDFFNGSKESFTHGNLTLENILYDPKEERVVLIDPYEENIIDSDLAELSQLLQSSNSKYEIYNQKDVKISSNTISCSIDENFGINYFNERLLEYININYSSKEYFFIKLMEISQFIRMLPFKMEVDPDKMLLFYGLASKLFRDLKIEYKKSEFYV